MFVNLNNIIMRWCCHYATATLLCCSNAKGSMVQVNNYLIKASTLVKYTSTPSNIVLVYERKFDDTKWKKKSIWTIVNASIEYKKCCCLKKWYSIESENVLDPLLLWPIPNYLVLRLYSHGKENINHHFSYSHSEIFSDTFGFKNFCFPKIIILYWNFSIWHFSENLDSFV